MRCNVCNVQSVMSKVQCGMYNVQCAMCNVERMYNVQSTVWKECALCYLHPAAPHVRHSRVTLSAANDLAGAFAGVPPRWPTHPDLSVFSTFGHPFSGAAPIGPKSNQVWFSVPWHGTTRATWQHWLMSKQQLGTWHQIGRHWAPVCGSDIEHHWAVCGSDGTKFKSTLTTHLPIAPARTRRSTMLCYCDTWSS